MCLSHGRRSGSCRCRCVFDTPVPWRVPGGDLHVPAQQIVGHIYLVRVAVAINQAFKCMGAIDMLHL